jgi:hypothetical protein
MSRRKFQQLLRESNDYRRKVMALQDPGGTDTRVYQVNIQIFPVSRFPGKRRRIKKK